MYTAHTRRGLGNINIIVGTDGTRQIPTQGRRPRRGIKRLSLWIYFHGRYIV